MVQGFRGTSGCELEQNFGAALKQAIQVEPLHPLQQIVSAWLSYDCSRITLYAPIGSPFFVLRFSTLENSTPGNSDLEGLIISL